MKTIKQILDMFGKVPIGNKPLPVIQWINGNPTIVSYDGMAVTYDDILHSTHQSMLIPPGTYEVNRTINLHNLSVVGSSGSIIYYNDYH